jgi:hypothetical protein
MQSVCIWSVLEPGFSLARAFPTADGLIRGGGTLLCEYSPGSVLRSASAVSGASHANLDSLTVVTRLWSGSWSVVVVVARKESARCSSGLS